MSFKLSKLKFSLVFMTVFAAMSLAWAQSVPNSFVYQGQITKSGGIPLEANPVVFNIRIYSAVNDCLLFEEQHSVNMLGSEGMFSLNVGAGIRSGTDFEDTSSLVDIFRNGVTFTGITNCTAGTSYNALAGHTRKVRVSYNDGGGSVTLAQDFHLQTVPYAWYANSLQGLTASNFVQINPGQNVTQAQLENLLGGTNYNTLFNLASGTPTTPLSMNNQQIKNLADPTVGQDAATKNYSDSRIGGSLLNLSGVGAGTGDGRVLAWNATLSQWEAITPSSITDSTKLPLAGGTMAGNINMNGNQVLNTGHVTMQNLSTITLGKFSNAQETTLIGTLGVGNKGATWYNNSTDKIMYWDGDSAEVVGNSSGTGDIESIVTNSGSGLSGGVTSGNATLTVVVDGLTLEINGSNQLQIRDGGITGIKLGADSVTSAKIQDGTIALADLAADSVNSSKIVDGSIVDADVNASAAIAWSKISKVGATAADVGAVAPARAINTNAGSGLTGGGDLSADRNLAINTDNTTLEIDTNTLRVKDGGIGNSKISAVAVDKITSAALQYFSYMPAGTECLPAEVLKWDATNDRWICGTDAGGVTAHSGLTGLGADDHTQYVMLAGRSGGQTIRGGTVASNHLILESTSDATKGHLLLQPNGGNVGLGTTTPAPIVAGRSVLDIYDASANGAELKLYSTTTRFRIFNNNGSNEVGFGSDSNSTVHLYTNGGGNRRISILGSGNVGINSSSPQSQLDVAGTIRANEICDESGSNCKDISSGWGAGGDIDGIVTNTGSALSGGTASGTSTLSVVTDGATIETNGSNQLQVRDSGISLAKLAADSVNSSKIVDGSITNADINGAAAIAWSKIDKTGATAGDIGAATSTRSINTNSGSGLTGGGDLSADRNLAINTDNSTLEIATNTLQIKDNGVTNTKINSVSINKITSAALQYFSYMPSGTECAPNEVLKWDAVTDRWLCGTDVGVSAHSSLTGLGADDHTQYALLAGRAGGQALIGGTAASNNLTLESTSDSTKGNIVLQPNGGNVGVGTATPNSKLEVYGAIRVLGGSASDGSNGYMFYGGSGDIDGGIHSPADGVIAFKTNSAEAMRIGPTSNVGIGTTNPSAKLEVVGSTLVSGVSTAAGFVPTVDAFPSSGLGARGAEGVVIVGRPGSNSEFSLWRPGLASQVLSVPSGTNNVAFDGNVGIGTTVPQGNLHIRGVGGGGIATLRLEDPNTAAGGLAQILLRDRGPASADDEIWSLRTTDTSHFGIGVLDNAELSYTERLSILRNGNVGIGSLTPNSLLDVAGTIRALEICDETGANCKDISAGWASGGVSASRNINTNSGSGLTGGGDLSADRSLAINTDNTTLEIATNTLRVKDGGITNAKINSVSITKISSAAAEYFSYMPAGTECTNGYTLVWDSTLDRWLCGALPSNFTVIHDTDNDTKIYLEKNADEDKIRFDTAGAERMIIDATGRVGIGSNFPLATLWVQGSGATYNEGLALVGNGSTNPSYIWNNSLGNLNFSGNGTSTPVMTVTNGFVGIGTTVPATQLSVATGSGQFANAISVLPSTHATSRRASMSIDDWGFIQDANGTGVKDFSIYQGSTGTHRFYIGATGNIGMGTATPHTSALLDVASTQKGFLPPRMTRAQRNAIATPSQGLMVFNTDDLTVDYYTGATWLSLNGSPKYIKLAMSAANQTVNVGSDIAFDTIRTSSGITRSGSGVNLKAGVTYRIEASVDTYLGDGNSYLGYQLHNGTSFIGNVAYTGEGDATFWGFKSAILEIYKPTVDVTVTVRVTDDNIGAGTVHGGWNTNLVVTELVPAGPAGGVSDNMGNHTASQNIALGSFWLSGDGGNEGITVGNTGNVGIGTTSGLVPLQIKGDTSSTGENLRLSAGNATEGGQISLMDGTGTSAWEIDNVGADGAEYLRFFRDKGETNLTAMVIGTSGNVGIGSISPTVALDVNGSITSKGPAGEATLGAFTANSGGMTDLTGFTVDTSVGGGFNATTGVFQPNVAGRYLITIYAYSGSSNNWIASVAKNGSARVSAGAVGVSGIGYMANGSVVISLNGTTDTVKVQIGNYSGSTVSGNSAVLTWTKLP